MICQKAVSVPDMHSIESQSQGVVSFVIAKDSEKPVEVTLKHPNGADYIRIKSSSYGGLEVDVVESLAKPK